MKPIVGEIAYKEFTPEEVARFVREAEEMRAQAVRDMFVAIYRGLALGVARTQHAFRGMLANPGIHPSKAH